MTAASKETTKIAESALLTGVQSKCQLRPSQLSVCGAPWPSCFQFEKHAYFHLGPAALVNVNQVGLGPINTDLRKDSLCTPQGLINDRSLLQQSKRVRGAAMNCKSETTDLPAMQTVRCIKAHLGMLLLNKSRSYCTLRYLPALVKRKKKRKDTGFETWSKIFFYMCKIYDSSGNLYLPL